MAQKRIDLKSPKNQIRISIDIGDKICYSVFADNELLLENNTMQLNLNGISLGEKPQLKNEKRKTVSNELKPVVPLKFSTVTDHYNELILEFKDNYSIEFRAYDNGIAYRFVSKINKDIEVLSEDFELNFPQDYLLHLQESGSFKTAYEEEYSHKYAKDWNSNDRMSTLPVLIEAANHRVLISESDLTDYPCMFLKGNRKGIFSTFPKVPLEFGENGDRSLKILREADYICKTSGTRTFPWRFFVITNDDKKILENTLAYQLASKSKVEDTSWINPGQVSWEWFNGAIAYGPDVNFQSGFNENTYKYFIDFASKNGIEYIIMDEGWAKSTRDPYTPNPNINVHKVIKYGKERNVGVILWLTWLTVENNMELFAKFEEWGVAGVKIDFMDRSDQWMVNYYERVAQEAAKHKILISYHGSFKPAGLEYKYPNILTYEGVRGLEQMHGCQPRNSIYLPFMRNAVGAMDFTPGAMINMQPDTYYAERPHSASVGTRCFQLAAYIVFESGLQMLSDTPSLYYQNQDCCDFITRVPVTWDETKALAAEVGEVAIVAKRKGSTWFIGGITNDKERTIDLEFDFLPSNSSYKITYFEDGVNAGRYGSDYKKTISEINSGGKIKIKMARNGGWAAIIE
nr:glycoside hydrolase family 97 protein [Dysgonomonas gadei]